jgi:hypothetical protein
VADRRGLTLAANLAALAPGSAAPEAGAISANARNENSITASLTHAALSASTTSISRDNFVSLVNKHFSTPACQSGVNGEVTLDATF